nr:hypothetical protein [Malonomonas rubra]
MIDTAIAGVDIEEATGDRCRENGSLFVDLFFETAFAAALANLFPMLIVIHFFRLF